MVAAFFGALQNVQQSPIGFYNRKDRFEKGRDY